MRRTAAVLSLPAFCPCSSHKWNYESDRKLLLKRFRGRDWAPLQLQSSWHRKLWRMLWDYWKDYIWWNWEVLLETILLICVCLSVWQNYENSTVRHFSTHFSVSKYQMKHCMLFLICYCKYNVVLSFSRMLIPCHLDPSHIFVVKALALSRMSVKRF